MEQIECTITNQYAYFTRISDEAYKLLNEYWSFSHPGARWSPAFKFYLRQKRKAIEEGEPDREIRGWDGKVRFLDTRSGKVSAGLFRATYKAIEAKLGLEFIREYDLPKLKTVTGFREKSAKYQFQNECVEKMVAAIKRGGGTVLSATGSGKTRTAALFFSKVECECLFVVDQKNLLYQSQKEIAEWLKEPVGLVGDSKFSLERVTVATIQTLDRHLVDQKFNRWFQRVKIVVVDELHKQMSRRNFSLLSMVEPIAKFGLTATLQMKQKPVRLNTYVFSGPVLFEFPILEGIEKDVLTDGQALQLRFPCVGEADVDEDDRDAIGREDEEIIYNGLKLRTCKRLIKWLLARGRYVFLLAYKIRHLNRLHELFHDVPHKYIFGGNLKTLNRADAIAEFDAGKINFIIASSVFNTGVNVKRIDAIVDLAESPNKNTVMQKFGRGVRKHKDKSMLLYFTFGTNGTKLKKAAVRQMRALRASGIKCKVVSVNDGDDAMLAVKQFYRKAMQ